MEIKIKDGDNEIIFTEEGLDNNNFIRVITKIEDEDSFSVEELYTAIKAFYDKMIREREDLLG